MKGLNEFMYRVIQNSNADITPTDSVLCMSNVRGRKIQNPHPMPFSFYFSAKEGQHSIRVKPVFNPTKMNTSTVGTLKLCDDWEYIPGPDDKSISSKKIREMKDFFREYLVLFCAVWDIQIDDGDVYDYFVGDITFDEMLQSFKFYEDYKDDLDQIHDIKSLESFCRRNNIVNMHGN